MNDKRYYVIVHEENGVLPNLYCSMDEAVNALNEHLSEYRKAICVTNHHFPMLSGEQNAAMRIVYYEKRISIHECVVSLLRKVVDAK